MLPSFTPALENGATRLAVLLLVLLPLQPLVAQCPTASDTGWVHLTDTHPDLDTLRLGTLPGGPTRFFRTDYTMRFKDHVPRAEQYAFLFQRCLRVLGRTTAGLLFIRAPDPGPDPAALSAAIHTIRSSPLVSTSLPFPLTGWSCGATG